MKKVILTKNEEAIQIIYRKAAEATKFLNNFVNQAETVAKIKFSNIDKISLMTNGTEFLTEYFKAKFPIPGATDEFNFQALGVDLEGLLKHNRKNIWQSYKFKLDKKGFFELDGEPEQIKACYTYVETEKQAEALLLGEDISALLNKAYELGYLEKRLITNVRNLGDLLDWELIPGTAKCKVVPNKILISRLMK